MIGVNKETFTVMTDIFKAYEFDRKKSHAQSTRNSLIPEDKVLLMLSYYREYRTLEHIEFDYAVSEATASRTVREGKDVLIKSGKFSLPSKRALYGDDIDLNS